jgi:hypothetical protein
VDSHDWTVMLMKYGMLSRDQEIGAALRSSGVLAMTLSIALAAWVLWVMRASGAESVPGLVVPKKREAGRG